MIAGLAARLPHKIAMELMLMGRPMSAPRAYEVGFVNQVVPNRAADRGGAGLGAPNWPIYAPLVLRTLKRFVNEQVLPKGPSELMALANRDLQAVQTSEDIAEGRAAFREKRPAQFKGR